MADEEKQKVRIKITKSDSEEGTQPRDADKPAMDDIAGKFNGKVTGGYKPGGKTSEIEGEIKLPKGVKKIEIEEK